HFSCLHRTSQIPLPELKSAPTRRSRRSAQSLLSSIQLFPLAVRCQQGVPLHGLSRVELSAMDKIWAKAYMLSGMTILAKVLSLSQPATVLQAPKTETAPRHNIQG